MPDGLTLPTLFGRATAVLGDHANLNALLDQLRDQCSAADEPVGAGTEANQLLELLRDRPRVHFAAEESEGYLGMLVSTQPALGTTISRLAAEHREFLSTVDDLLALSQGPNPGQKVARAPNDFLDRFKAHERAENALLQDFFLQDEGDSGH